MSRRTVWLLSTVVLAVGLLAAVPGASADTLQISPTLTATGSLTTGVNSFTLTFTLSNTGTTSAGITDFSLQLFTGGPSATFTVTSVSGSGTSLSGFEYFADTKQNNGSSNECNSTTNKGWLCVDYSGGFGTIPSHGSLDFVFSGTYDSTSAGVMSPLELMAQGCFQVNTSGSAPSCVFNGDGSFNVSQPMNGTSVPDPPTVAMLALGLIGVGGFGLLWRRLRESWT